MYLIDVYDVSHFLNTGLTEINTSNHDSWSVGDLSFT